MASLKSWDPLLASGLTEEEKEEGRKAKEALAEEAGGDGEDGEDGNYKGKSQFFTHLKKSEVRHIVPQAALVED